MKELIQREQKQFVVCDNPTCDFEILTGEETMESIGYIDMPCPKCEQNLLTIEDYLAHKKMVKVIDFINKWFSWLTIFSGKVKPEDYRSVVVHTHDGIKFSKEKQPDKDVPKQKMVPQLAVSNTADLEEHTWTFDMKEDFSVSAGEFVIIPKDIYEEIIVNIKAIKTNNLIKSANHHIERRVNWLLEKLEFKTKANG